jgi:hypothetical protein
VALECILTTIQFGRYNQGKQQPKDGTYWPSQANTSSNTDKKDNNDN